MHRGCIIQSEYPEIIKNIPLKSGVCGYDAEVQVIILNNLHKDYGINASTFLIPASRSGGMVDHAEIFLHTEGGTNIMGSNYERIYLLGEDPYSRDQNLILMGEKDWFKVTGGKNAFLQMFSGIIFPYRPDKVTIEKFYSLLNVDIAPICPYIDIRDELLKSSYVVYPSYVNFIIEDAYVSQFLSYVKNRGIDKKVISEANKLESARKYWYDKKGYELYEGKNPETFVFLIPSSPFNATYVYINVRTSQVEKFVQKLKTHEKEAYKRILSLL
ncbi:MAG: hypothetical protein U9N35_00925 [Euryarchaeota archaeon]|nr:hypothetical protein [Euryarchaeota archaeon]